MDRDKFTMLVRGEQGALRRFLLALCCGDGNSADDIAQESLVKAYLSSNNYQDKGQFTAWIYKIAYRTFLDYKKSSRKHLPLEQADNISDTSLTSDSTFRYQELYAALNGLPPKERTAILLFYIKGYSIKEISQITDISEDAVKKQLSRGRDHLKVKIKNYG